MLPDSSSVSKYNTILFYNKLNLTSPFRIRVQKKNAYPSSDDPLPYKRSPLITGFQGPNPSDHYSVSGGYLSIWPYIRMFFL